MFGGNAFAWPPFAGGVLRRLRQLPGFTSGILLAAGVAEGASIAGSVGEASALPGAASEGLTAAEGGGSITAVPAFAAEARADRRFS